MTNNKSYLHGKSNIQNQQKKSTSTEAYVNLCTGLGKVATFQQRLHMDYTPLSVDTIFKSRLFPVRISAIEGCR